MNKRKVFFYPTLWLVLLVLLSSCRTAGLYTSNPKGKATFAGTELEFTQSDSFYIRTWTDSYTHFVDSVGNRIFTEDVRYRGFGTYECLDDSVALTFCNEDSISIVLDVTRNDASVKLSFHILDELGNIFQPSVDILDGKGKRIDGSLVQLEDVFQFNIGENKNPVNIKLYGFGVNVENPIIDISNLSNGSYVFKRKTYNGYFPKGVVKNIWFRRVPTGIRYQMDTRKRYLPKKWGWSWLNKLYRDY